MLLLGFRDAGQTVRWTAFATSRHIRQGISNLGVKIGHILCKLVIFILILNKMMFELDQRAIPKPALHNGGEDELPFLCLISIVLLLDGVNIVFRRYTFPDILSINHIFLVEVDNERTTFC